MSPQDKADHERKIKSALKKINLYNKSGRLGEIIELSKGMLSENTIRSWLSDNKKAYSAYKSHVLIDIGEKIEPIGNKKWIAYEIAVSELCVSKKDQDRLREYDGLYEVHHDISEHYTSDLTKITFGTKANYQFFWTKYKSVDADRFCDGFTFIRDSKIVLAGTSKQVTIFASLRIQEEDKFSLLGTLMLDDHKLQKTFSSKIAMHKRDQPKSPTTEASMSSYSVGSGYEV